MRYHMESIAVHPQFIAMYQQVHVYDQSMFAMVSPRVPRFKMKLPRKVELDTIIFPVECHNFLQIFREIRHNWYA